MKTLQTKRALRATLLFLLIGAMGITKAQTGNIVFTDANVKSLCIANWDTDGDDNLSYDEAAAVTTLGTVFSFNKSITSFNELQYFTGLNSIGDGTFSWCTNLISVEIPNSVTSIGQYAFSYCTNLTTVTICNFVTSIGERAFESCISLTSVDIPNSVTSIGEAAFSACYGLTSIEIPNSITSIGNFAFGTCFGLTSIVVALDNTVYDSRDDCNAIIETATNTLVSGCKNTVIPNSVTSIGEAAFYSCSSLTSIEIPNSVTSIGDYAFKDGTGLTTLTIPNSVISIGKEAFAECYSLTWINSLAITPPLLGSNVFLNVSVSTTVNVPCGTLAAYQAASGWSNFTNITECNIAFADPNVKAICVARWDSNGDGELSYDEAEAVTNLGTAFKDNVNIISFDELQYFTGLTSIGEEAFSDCSSLTSIEIPISVTSIGEEAFYDCSSLTSIEIPNSVTSIGMAAYNGCSGLTSVMIHNSVTSIGQLAFANCGNLASIEIPNSVTFIGLSAFFDCAGLTSIEIPNSVSTIESYAFSGCTGLTSMVVALDNSVYDSRDNCNAIVETATNTLVSGCKNTVIPNSVTSIGNVAFFRCSSLTSIGIPNSVTSIGEGAFEHCTGLASIDIPNSVTSIGCEAFYDCTSLISIEIPNSVTSIEGGVFFGCIGLTSIDLPNSIISIGEWAFQNCTDLTSVEIPNSVTSIDSWAFQDCTGLTEITVLGTNVPSLGDYVFDNTNNCPIYVPYESLNDYKTATNWSDYEDRIYPMSYTTIPGYGESEGNYRFIASPLVEDTDPTTVDNMITETTYDLYRFDQSEDAEWQNYKANEDFVLENGQGYLYANVEEVNVIFKGDFNEDETKEVGLAYDANADFAGWNLVGNPFPVSAYANKSYYTMNEDGTAVEPNMFSSATPILACTGIMVMAEAEGETVVFGKEAPETVSNKGNIQIAVTQTNTRGNAVQDNAIVSFNSGDRLEKFVFNKDEARISIPQSGKELAIACTDKQGEVPLNFKATKNGQYTLTVNTEAVKLDYLHLIDNLTGADANLLVVPSYTFEAKTTDYASRFRLVFSANDTDGPSTGSETFAFVNNGNIIINGEGVLQIVDVIGRIIVSEDVSGNVSTANMIPGVYVLRLINGNDVKTQKIVIE